MVQREVRARTVSPATEPERTCVGCRVRAPAGGLLRVVAHGSFLVPDPRRRSPGRGAWVHVSLECVRLAERRRAFPRALRVTGQLDIGAVVDHVGRAQSRQDRDDGNDRRTTRKQAENS